MKKLIYTALLSAALIQSPAAHADVLGIGKAFKKVTHDIKGAAYEAGDGIKHTAYELGDKLKHVGHEISGGTMSALNQIAHTAKQSVEAIKDTTWKTGDAFKKAGYVTGKALTSKEFVEGLKVAAVVGDIALTTMVPEVAAAMEIPAVRQMHNQMMQQMLAPHQPQRQPSAPGEQAPPVDPNAPLPEVLAEIKEPVTQILTATLCNNQYKDHMIRDMKEISGEVLENVKNATIALASGRLDEDTMVGIFQSAADGNKPELLVLAMLFNGAKPDAPAAIRKLSSACPA